MRPDTALYVLFDRSGRILAATAQDSEPLANRDAVPPPRPAAERGQFTAVVRVPADAQEKDLVAIGGDYIVKGRGDRATLVARGAASKATRRATSVTRPSAAPKARKRRK
jgi:hypothetical protein